MKRVKYLFPAILIVFALVLSGCEKDDSDECPTEQQTRSQRNQSLLLGTWEETYYVSFDIVDGKPTGYSIMPYAQGALKMELFGDGTFKTTILSGGEYYISTGKYVYNDSDAPTVKLTYDSDGYEVEFTIVTLSQTELTFREERIPGTPSADKWRPTRYLVWDMHYTRMN